MRLRTMEDDLLAKRSVEEDLEEIKEKTIELGSHGRMKVDAKVIPACDVVVDERAKYKCYYPMCRWFGSNIMCPPVTPMADEVRQLVNKYKYAIMIRVYGKPEHFTREGWERRLNHKYFMKLNNLVHMVEVYAQRKGYYLAIGFGAGHCRFCGLEINPKVKCKAMINGTIDYTKCSYSLRIRPPMEAVGLDAFQTALNAGWEANFIGLTSGSGWLTEEDKTEDTKGIKTASNFGVVFIT